MSTSSLLFAAIGAVAGVLSGFFGIGGGVIIVPALIYLAGFNQHLATGTSLAVLLPPVGVGAAIEYYRNGDVDIRAAAIIAAALLASGWLASRVATRLTGPHLQLAFGLFVTGLGLSILWGSARHLGWI